MDWARLPLVLLVLLAAAGPREAPGNRTSLASWMLIQIRAGKDVDFNARCGTGDLDPHSPDDPRWAANCRAVDPDTLRALLTKQELAEAAPHGIRLRGARIDGTLNLDDAHVTAPEFTMINSSLAGDLTLTTAHLDGWLVLHGTVINGNLDASTSRIDQGIDIDEKSVIGGGVSLVAATVGGVVIMKDATLRSGMNAGSAQVNYILGIINVESDGDVLLDLSRIHGYVAIDSSRLNGGKQLSMIGARIDHTFVLQASALSGGANFSGMQTTGPCALNGVTIAAGKRLIAEGLRAEALLAMNNVEVGGNLILDNAEVRTNLLMNAVKFPTGTVSAVGLHVGGTLDFATPTEFHDNVSFDHAAIGRDLSAPGMKIAAGKTFSATDVQIGGNLLLPNSEFGGKVMLNRANVQGQAWLDGAKFLPGAVLSAENMTVGQDFFFRNARVVNLINAMFLSVRDSLDLRGSTLGGIDLSDAAIGGDLRLGRFAPDDGTAASPMKWAMPDGSPPQVVLRNVKVGNLQDDARSWDGTKLLLEGFVYGHLGGAGGVSGEDMRYRSVRAWKNWLGQDTVYSPQPYTQLASVLAAGGNSGSAAEIRFASRNRQREELLRGCRLGHRPAPAAATIHVPCDRAGWFGLSLLQATIGYGIGTYTFRALWWTLGLTAAGTIVLAFAPGVRSQDGNRGKRQKPLIWCFGATLNHVLPVVTLNPEFNDFFNDPKQERLYPWQQIAFAILALCGWALSFFVIAALSGLTQG